MSEQKCPRCGHGAVIVFAASGQQMRGGHRCGNRKCLLPVLLWDEWMAMKEQIEGHQKHAEKIEKMARDHLLSNTNRSNGMVEARPRATEVVQAAKEMTA